MSIVHAKGNKNAVTNVPLLDLKAQYEQLRPAVEDAIKAVCDSQHFIMGPNVAELEESIADYCQAGYGIGVSSGTDALLAALMALDVGPGDEVITTPFTFFATGGVVARLGARPVFCDIEADTFNIDPKAIRQFVQSKCERSPEGLRNRVTGGHVRVVMPVHLFGQMADMPEIMAIAKEFDLRVIEDAAQAIGAEDADGRRAGSIGDIGCFSFFPSKNLGAFGDAGMCVTNDSELAERLRVLRVHGGKPKYYHAVVGGNFRLDALQAAILLVKIRYLDSWTSDRRQNAERYDRLFDSLGLKVVTPATRSRVRHIYNQYTLRVSHRDSLRAHLTDKNVGTEIYYPVPLHLQECFSGLGYSIGDCPVAEEAARCVLSIPIYPELAEDQLRYVVDSCAEFLGTNN